MRADWGTKDKDIGKLMDKLQGSRQIPLLAVFPAERPNNPVVLKTYYTKAKLVAKLKQAGSSTLARKPETSALGVGQQNNGNAELIISQLP